MKLENARLRVTFAAPEEIISQRFDRTAMVTQVLLDGKYPFCTPEQLLPGRNTTHGVGLCGEFVLAGAAEAAGAGQWFCKPGVGLLRQQNSGAPYDMWRQYKLRPFPVTADSAENAITFRQRAVPCGGYGLEIEKRFSLAENRLMLDISVENIGEKECFLQEYQHNFVSVEGLEVAEGYRLELGCHRALKGIESCTLRQGDEIQLPSAVRAEGDRVRWETDLRGKVLYHRWEEINDRGPFSWRLSHERSRASVSEETDFRPTRIDVWAVEHCVCTEFYQSLRLAPGQTARWRRTWTFEG